MSDEKKGARRPIKERLEEMQRQLLSMAGERTAEAAALRPDLVALAQQTGTVLREAEGLSERGLEPAT